MPLSPLVLLSPNMCVRLFRFDAVGHATRILQSAHMYESLTVTVDPFECKNPSVYVLRGDGLHTL